MSTPMGESAWLRRSLQISRTTLKVILAAISLVAAVITIWLVLPRHHVHVALTDPLSGGISTPEPCHVTIKGTGSVPDGQTMIVSNQERGTGPNVDHELYFAQATAPDPDEWYVSEQLGAGKTKPGTPYTITVWLVADSWAKYIASLPQVARAGQASWWSSPAPPPGAKNVASALVTRVGSC